MSRNCLLCGVGGQGVVLASRLIAYAWMEQGDFVRTTETIGMAQRGGSVVSHVRSGKVVHSPQIPQGGADVILAFEPGEAVRSLPYLKTGGTVITNSRIVRPVTASLGQSGYSGEEMLAYLKAHADRLFVIDGEAVCGQAGSPKVLNVALLGAAAGSGILGIPVDEMKEAVRSHVKEKYIALNMEALRLGAELVKTGNDS